MTPNLASNWRSVRPHPLTLVIGSEQYLAGRAVLGLKELLRQSHPGLEVAEVAEGEYSSGLLLSIAAPSLFAEPRLVIINGVGDGLLEDLEEVLGQAPEETYVVVRLSNLVGQASKIKTSFAQTAQQVQCDPIKRETDRADFVRTEFQNLGRQVEPAAIRALITAFTEDLGELGAAVAQLAHGEHQKITQQHVDEIFLGRQETNSFKIADAALGGNPAEAVRLLRHGFNTGVDPVALTAALAMRVRQLARLISDKNAPAASLGMQPWQLDRVKKDLSGWTEAALADLVRQTAQTDADVKGASRDPEYSLERLLMAMARRA